MKKVKLKYVPHGINSKVFYPIGVTDPDWEEFSKFRDDFKKNNDVEFIVFWNNRNIRRKQPGDVILAFKTFCDMLPVEKRQKVCLFMKTQVSDPNGTDLLAVKKNICPKYKVFFDENLMHPKILNYFYNLADVTINIGSNEGFGLSNAESIMAGTVTITNVTGGLQDQCRFVRCFADGREEPIEFTEEFPSNHAGTFKDCGEWSVPVFPTNRSLQGSTLTPYIFDDRCSFEDVAKAIYKWYSKTPEQIQYAGHLGRQWMLSEESGMSAVEMCNRMIVAIDNLLETWTPPEPINIEKFQPKQYTENIGIV